MRKFVIAAAVAACLAASTSSHAAVQIAIAPPGADVIGFATPTMVAVKGQALQFVNADPVAPHNIESVEYGSNSKPWCSEYLVNKCPRFASALVEVGGTSTADLGATAVGKTYEFICRVHTDMRGTLNVVA